MTLIRILEVQAGTFEKTCFESCRSHSRYVTKGSKDSRTEEWREMGAKADHDLSPQPCIPTRDGLSPPHIITEHSPLQWNDG